MDAFWIANANESAGTLVPLTMQLMWADHEEYNSNKGQKKDIAQLNSDLNKQNLWTRFRNIMKAFVSMLTGSTWRMLVKLFGFS